MPLYPAMYSTTARLAPARVGQALVSMNSPLSEEKKLSASALSQHWPPLPCVPASPAPVTRVGRGGSLTLF